MNVKLLLDIPSLTRSFGFDEATYVIPRAEEWVRILTVNDDAFTFCLKYLKIHWCFLVLNQAKTEKKLFYTSLKAIIRPKKVASGC